MLWPRPIGQVVVTGAARGIGQAACLRLLSLGAYVAGIDRSLDGLAALSQIHDRFLALPADVTSESDITSAIERIQHPIDVLICAAGVGGFGPFMSVREDTFMRAMDVNFLGTVRIIRHVLPAMIRRNQGHIVLLSSISGRISFPGSSAYCGSKAALEGFAESLRRECLESGIRVSILNPGDVDTGFYQNALNEGLLGNDDVRGTQRRGMPVDVVVDAIEDILRRPRRQLYLPPNRGFIAGVEACFPATTGLLLTRRRPPVVRFRGNMVALVTGASSGIGRALAGQLLAQGLSVILVARNGPLLEEAAREWKELPGHATVLPLDLRDTAAVHEAIDFIAEKFNRRIDLLVNNAGYSVRGTVLDVPTEKYRDNLQTNYMAPIILMRSVLPWMQQRDHGQIVNVLSTTAVRGIAGLSSYCATKFALRAVSRCVDREITSLGARVRVTEVLPGNVDTAFFEHVERFGTADSGRPSKAKPVAEVAAAIVRHLSRGSTSSFTSLGGFALQVARVVLPTILDRLESRRISHLAIHKSHDS